MTPQFLKLCFIFFDVIKQIQRADYSVHTDSLSLSFTLLRKESQFKFRRVSWYVLYFVIGTSEDVNEFGSS
jgi:hypothetical protein